MHTHRVPLLIALLIAVDIGLVAAPVVDHAAGSPFARLRNFIDLDGESTLPTWYSSMQWLAAGCLFGLFATYAARTRLPGGLAVCVLALACVTFSIDEIAGLHEWLGEKSDALLAGGDRANTVFWATGIWPFLLGIPIIAMLALAVVQMRNLFLPRSPRALWLLVTGLAITFSGALGIELAANLIEIRPENDGLLLAQLVFEEGMEMLGVSLVIWSAYELLQAYGFRLQQPQATQTSHAPARRGSPRNAHLD